MESQIAIYPRVCVGSLVVEESERSGMCFPPFNAVNVIKVDRDGICFVDWLSLAAQNDKAWTLDPFVENFMFRVKAAIRNELAQWRGQPRILQKYLWLVSHWNEVAAQHPTKLSPIGPLGDGAPYRDAEPAR